MIHKGKMQECELPALLDMRDSLALPSTSQPTPNLQVRGRGSLWIIMHCNSGHHRAPTMAAILHMMTSGADPETAVSMIQRERPVAELWRRDLHAFLG